MHGGGVSVFVLNTLKVDIDNSRTGLFESHEALTLNIVFNNFKFRLLAVYRPPNKSDSAFVQYIKSHFRRKMKNTLIVGDINLNLLNSKYKHAQNFDVHLSNKNFVNVVDKPTRNSYRGTLSLLDHIWSNFNTKYEAFVFQGPITDHLPVLCIFDIFHRNVNHTLVFRDFSLKNKMRLYEVIPAEKSKFLAKYNLLHDSKKKILLDKKCRSLNSWLITMCNTYCPIKRQKVSRNFSCIRGLMEISKNVLTRNTNYLNYSKRRKLLTIFSVTIANL